MYTVHKTIRRAALDCKHKWLWHLTQPIWLVSLGSKLYLTHSFSLVLKTAIYGMTARATYVVCIRRVHKQVVSHAARRDGLQAETSDSRRPSQQKMRTLKPILDLIRADTYGQNAVEFLSVAARSQACPSSSASNFLTYPHAGYRSAIAGTRIYQYRTSNPAKLCSVFFDTFISIPISAKT